MARPDYDIPIEVVQRNIDHLGINYNELPQLPFWAPVFGKTTQAFKQNVATKIMKDSAFAGRELTQPEKNALAHHYARCLAIQTWNSPVVLASAYALYRSTHATYGFPFWTPKADKFDPKKVPFIPGLPQELGPKTWHGLRFVAWFACCKLAIGPFFLSYAISNYLANANADPQLKEFRESVQSKVRQRRTEAGMLKPVKEGISEFPDADSPNNPWADTEQNTASPQPAWSRAQSSPSGRTQEALSDEASYLFDDASPVAPTEQQRIAEQQKSQVSAWDRIRSQVRPSAAASSQGPSGQKSAWARKREEELASKSGSDETAFNFASRDEEKPYAKDRAQRDFDEMLERERRGQTSGRQ